MIQYFIISPDGFPTQMEPFSCEGGGLEKDVKKNFNKWKERYEIQGYYSSNNGRIPLEDLEYYCSIQKVEG